MDDDGCPVIIQPYSRTLSNHSSHDITPINPSRRCHLNIFGIHSPRFSPASLLPSDAPSKDPQTSGATKKGLENHHHHNDINDNNDDDDDNNNNNDDDDDDNNHNNNNNNNNNDNNDNDNNKNNKDTFIMMK